MFREPHLNSNRILVPTQPEGNTIVPTYPWFQSPLVNGGPKLLNGKFQK